MSSVARALRIARRSPFARSASPSPKIERIEVVRQGDVRRAKLYYLRKKVGKAAKIKEKAYR